jgi:hypothetical protein
LSWANSLQQTPNQLMPYYRTSGRWSSIRRAVDALLERDLRAKCWAMGGAQQLGCLAAEDAVMSGVTFNSARQFYGVP